MKTFTTIIAPVFALLLILAGCGGQNGGQAEMEAEASEPMAETSEEYSGPNADLVAEFEKSGDVLMASLDGVHGDQWTFHESDDRWNIAEIVEHIVMVENALVQGFVGGLLEGEPNAENAGNYEEGDEALRMMIRDRTNPIQAADALRPTGKYATPEEAIAAFDSTRANTIDFLKSTDKDLRLYTGTIAPGAIDPMDAHRWLIFAAGHVERHSAQIDQVKADPNYPEM